MLYTDHKPLTTILGEKKGVPPMAAARLQCWALLLTANDYTIQYKSTQNHGNADGLSRLPLSTESEPAGNVLNIQQIEALPTTAIQLKQATQRDPILSRVLRYTRSGWPGKVPEALKPYHNRQTTVFRRQLLVVVLSCDRSFLFAGQYSPGVAPESLRRHTV